VASKRVFFSTNQVAQTLGVSPFTIRRYIKLRKLKAVKLEGSYRVRQTDLDHFLKAREIETEEELGENQSIEPKSATVHSRPSETERKHSTHISSRVTK
jgi:excisionase family DNA binding protein